MDRIIIMLHGVSALCSVLVQQARGRVREVVGGLARRDEGQAVTEYTLVILVAASVALLLLNWVQGGALTAFFDNIFNQVTGMFSTP